MRWMIGGDYHFPLRCSRAFLFWPELTKRPFFTLKRTYQERYAALGKASACVRSGLNPSIFSDGMCSTPPAPIGVLILIVAGFSS